MIEKIIISEYITMLNNIEEVEKEMTEGQNDV